MIMTTSKNSFVQKNQSTVIDLRGKQSVSSNYPFFIKGKIKPFPSLIQAETSLKKSDTGLNLLARKIGRLFSSNEFKTSFSHASIRWSERKIHLDNI